MPSAPRTARAVARAELTRAILDRAREQLAEVGPAALSVRAIARDLGMASSAVYRYFPSRDALLTALIIDGYDDLGAAVEAADAGVRQRRRLDLRFGAVCHAVRDWARADPHRYGLLYGTPVPGYAAPDDTVAPATRTTSLLVSIVAAAQEAGCQPASATTMSRAEIAAIAPLTSFVALDSPIDPEFALRASVVYATLFGHISLELFGHFHRAILDYDTHFAHVVDQMAVDLGLRTA
jgi:AcrR family transcriptional regulator